MCVHFHLCLIAFHIALINVIFITCIVVVSREAHFWCRDYTCCRFGEGEVCTLKLCLAEAVSTCICACACVYACIIFLANAFLIETSLLIIPAFLLLLYCPYNTDAGGERNVAVAVLYFQNKCKSLRQWLWRSSKSETLGNECKKCAHGHFHARPFWWECCRCLLCSVACSMHGILEIVWAASSNWRFIPPTITRRKVLGHRESPQWQGALCRLPRLYLPFFRIVSCCARCMRVSCPMYYVVVYDRVCHLFQVPPCFQ